MAASTSIHPVEHQLENNSLKEKLKALCKRGADAINLADPKLVADAADIGSYLSNGLPIASQITGVVSFFAKTVSANFENSEKLKVVQRYAEELKGNILKLATDGGDWRDYVTSLYVEADKFRNISGQELICALHIGKELDCLAEKLQTLNSEVRQRLIIDDQKRILKGQADNQDGLKVMLDRQEKYCTSLESLPSGILDGKEAVLEFLDKPGKHVVSIVGMGGVGKTTMMNALHQYILLKDTELAIAKVHIGKEPNLSLKEVQQEILSKIEDKKEIFDTSNQGQSRLNECFKKLQDANKTLCLYVDNVWTCQQLRTLFNCQTYSNLPSSSYIILTTRSNQVVECFRELFSSAEEEKVEEEYRNYELQKLAIEKATKVFREEAQREGEYLSDELVDTIVPLCDGLPLALHVFANHFKMCPKNKKRWQDVAKCIKKARESASNASSYADIDEEVLPSLEASVDFQKPNVVEAFVDAVLFWRYKPFEEARYALSRNDEFVYPLDRLRAHSIIEKGEYGELNCHDLFVPIARKKAQEKSWVYLTDDQQEDMNINSIIRGLHSPSLCHTMHSNRSMHSKFLMSLQYLSINSHERQIPGQIDAFICLRTLDLSGCEELNALPLSIGNLTSLESLSFRMCVKLVTLPDSIGKLASLRFLSLRGCMKIATLPNSISSLSLLKALDLRGCIALSALPDIRDLTSLESLNLRGCAYLIRPNYIERFIPQCIVIF